jgi:hypothetical protein
MRRERRVWPEEGSGRSSTRLAESSQVKPEHILVEIAACQATRGEYFALWLKDKIVCKGGTSLIFVPSGNTLEDEPYHWLKHCHIAAALLEADSRCSA